MEKKDPKEIIIPETPAERLFAIPPCRAYRYFLNSTPNSSAFYSPIVSYTSPDSFNFAINNSLYGTKGPIKQIKYSEPEEYDFITPFPLSIDKNITLDLGPNKTEEELTMEKLKTALNTILGSINDKDPTYQAHLKKLLATFEECKQNVEQRNLKDSKALAEEYEIRIEEIKGKIAKIETSKPDELKDKLIQLKQNLGQLKAKLEQLNTKLGLLSANSKASH